MTDQAHIVMLPENYPLNDPEEDRRRPADVVAQGLKPEYGGSIDNMKSMPRDMLHEVIPLSLPQFHST